MVSEQAVEPPELLRQMLCMLMLEARRLRANDEDADDPWRVKIYFVHETAEMRCVGRRGSLFSMVGLLFGFCVESEGAVCGCDCGLASAIFSDAAEGGFALGGKGTSGAWP
jgi:hypothetical protein